MPGLPPHLRGRAGGVEAVGIPVCSFCLMGSRVEGVTALKHPPGWLQSQSCAILLSADIEETSFRPEVLG